MTTNMMTTSAERLQADATPNQTRKRGVKMLLSATVASVALTIGLAGPASAAPPVSTVNSTAACPTQSCKTMYGQPLLPILSSRYRSTLGSDPSRCLEPAALIAWIRRSLREISPLTASSVALGCAAGSAI